MFGGELMPDFLGNSAQEIGSRLTQRGLQLDLNSRVISKIMTKYELFKRTVDVPGDIFEGGVYRGASLFLWASLLDVFCSSSDKKVVGFDTFIGFPPVVSNSTDRESLQNIVRNNQEYLPRSLDEIWEMARGLRLDHRIELYPGSVEESLPVFLRDNPGWRASILHFDFDIYDPTKAALTLAFNRLTYGGVAIFDQYGDRKWLEGDAADEFFAGRAAVKCLPWSAGSVAYVVREPNASDNRL